jgi:hypothetical protein
MSVSQPRSVPPAGVVGGIFFDMLNLALDESREVNLKIKVACHAKSVNYINNNGNYITFGMNRLHNFDN